MDNDQQNTPPAYQPGTTVPPPDPNLTPQIPQAPQPATPQQPVQPPTQTYQPDQQTAYSQANPYGDQAFQAAPEYEYQSTESQASSGLRDLLNQRTIIILGAAFTFLVLVLVLLAFISGDRLSLQRVESQEISFSIDVPEGWETSITSAGTQLDYVSASPPDAPEGDPTSVVVTREKEQREASTFSEGRERGIALLNSGEAANVSNSFIGDIDILRYGTSLLPAYRIRYTQTFDSTNITVKVESYSVLQGDGTVVNINFNYSDTYASLGNSVEDILASYAASE